MYITFDASKPWGKRIADALTRRELVPVTDAEWEKHGPHEGMPYLVFIAEARRAGEERTLSVTIYPHAVYHHQDGDQWSRWEDTDTHAGWVTRIRTLDTKRRHTPPASAEERAV